MPKKNSKQTAVTTSVILTEPTVDNTPNLVMIAEVDAEEGTAIYIQRDTGIIYESPMLSQRLWEMTPKESVYWIQWAQETANRIGGCFSHETEGFRLWSMKVVSMMR